MTQHLLSLLFLRLLILACGIVLFLACSADLPPYTALPAFLFPLSLLLLRLVGKQLPLSLGTLAVILLFFKLLLIDFRVHDLSLDIFDCANAFLDLAPCFDIRFQADQDRV